MVDRPTRRPDRTTAVNSGRRRRRACAGNTSGGELLATLAPTAGDDRPARAGAHPQPEAVGLGPTTVVRLERALAHEVLPLHDIGGRAPAGRPARSGTGGGGCYRTPGPPEAGCCGTTGTHGQPCGTPGRPTDSDQHSRGNGPAVGPGDPGSIR